MTACVLLSLAEDFHLVSAVPQSLDTRDPSSWTAIIEPFTGTSHLYPRILNRVSEGLTWASWEADEWRVLQPV